MESSDLSLATIQANNSKSLRELTSGSRPPDKERDLRGYLSLVLKRKWLILTIVICSTTAVGLYALSLPSLYQSTATLQLDTKVLSDAQSRGEGAHEINYEYANTQIRLLSNPELTRKVVLKLNLDRNASFLKPQGTESFSTQFRRLFERGARSPAIPLPAVPQTADIKESSRIRTNELEPFVGAVLAGLKIEPVDQTNLIQVSMTHTDPQLATQIVDELTRTFVADNIEYENRDADAAAETLARQIADLQSKVRQKEDDRLNYLKGHHLPLEKGEGRNLTTDRLSKLSSQLLDAENDRKNVEATYEAAKAARDSATISALRDSDESRELRKHLRELEQKRAAMLQVYTAEWPEIKKIDAEIRQVREGIAQSWQEALNALKSKLDAAAAREGKLREAYFREQGAADNQSQDAVQLASLNQQIETDRQVYNMLFQRQTEMQVKSLDKSNHVGIVTSPVTPVAPIGPSRTDKIAIAFALSLIGSLGLAILMNQFATNLTSADDILNYTNLPTLAVIPVGAGSDHRSLKGAILNRLGRRHTGNALSLTEDVRSPTAEAYRHLRSSLLFSAPVTPRTILVTSGSPFEGKTTTAINTAVTLAQNGARVVLIDCDLRRPRLHTHFKLSNVEGLTTFLSGELDFDSLIMAHQPFPTLKIITAGPTPANPADCLGSIKMRVMLELLAKMFDHIIIDSPPASSFADASILATLVDEVVLVVHSQRSSRNVVKRVKERLESMGASVCGVVLNCADLEADEYYSGYYKYYA